MVPGMSVVPSILAMPGGGGPVHLVHECGKPSVDKETLLRAPVKVMEFGAGGVAATPVPDHFGVRANKDKFNLRDLSQRIQTFDK